MLRVGLTGGIGSGKSTVAQRFRELGATVIDADQLAREVVAVGSMGLAAIRYRFGDAVMASDGSLDRGALGAIVFADPQARQELESITHPLIGARARELMESAALEKIVVHEVPLLAELNMAAAYHLTVAVCADSDTRMARLTGGGRGLAEADARARIAAQASDRARQAATDVWLDNNANVDGLLARVDALWRDRIVGFNENLLTGSCSPGQGTPSLVPYDDSWPLAAARLVQRITMVLGERAVAVEHIGSTSVPGLSARDVIDLQVAVHRLSDADEPEFVRALTDKGFPRPNDSDQDAADPGAPGVSLWATRVHGCADPGRVVRLHVREHRSPRWELDILFRDWLIANPGERGDYAHLKAALAQSEATTAGYVAARQPWLASALERARVWARLTGWSRT